MWPERKIKTAERNEKGAVMKLIIGGYAQGKLSYVLSCVAQGSERIRKDAPYLLIDEHTMDIPNAEQIAGKTVIVNHLHRIIRAEGSREQAQLWIQSLEEVCRSAGSELILICDELGCGIVPVSGEDRDYRENVGRIVCELAGRAESVERIVCGIASRLR